MQPLTAILRLSVQILFVVAPKNCFVVTKSTFFFLEPFLSLVFDFFFKIIFRITIQTCWGLFSNFFGFDPWLNFCIFGEPILKRPFLVLVFSFFNC
jgi:hypothetical protein